MIIQRGILARAIAAVAALVLLALPAAAMERKPFEQAAYDAAIAAGGPVVIHVAAVWCSVCLAQERILDEIGGDPAFAKLTIFRVDFDAQRDVMRAFRTPFRSTFVAFRNGAEADRISARIRKADVTAFLLAAVAP